VATALADLVRPKSRFLPSAGMLGSGGWLDSGPWRFTVESGGCAGNQSQRWLWSALKNIPNKFCISWY
jgi:hypothetical protein